MTFGVILMAGPIIRLFAGPAFEPAILTLQLISPILLMIAISGILGMQVLYPLGKENIVIICTAIGAVVNFTLNIFLIPRYAQYGAAFATSIAESCVTISMLIIGRKYLPIQIFTKHTTVYIIGTLIMFLLLIGLMTLFNLNDIYTILIYVPLAVFVYFAWLLIFKDPLAKEAINILKRKITL